MQDTAPVSLLQLYPGVKTKMTLPMDVSSLTSCTYPRHSMSTVAAPSKPGISAASSQTTLGPNISALLAEQRLSRHLQANRLALRAARKPSTYLQPLVGKEGWGCAAD